MTSLILAFASALGLLVLIELAVVLGVRRAVIAWVASDTRPPARWTRTAVQAVLW